ncbi:outer membrane protein assembly factor BamB family protein [Alteraurantiacibacter buctensis]|uniref:PQQ-binding-like beta-propeller repeat protein n=1 Tax=Alteraurantiacibacter buctensis TaxID=1503981 RepID=A0A844YZW8_9SPHN|nr:PQQ-binding-like beta-propeller repeat protein [Alteraurantiacibacter buctensis]MXO72004.1 PQQ-binding-like beta-propeller repeat protein [Alteraurantiacibacter buctensis]
MFISARRTARLAATTALAVALAACATTGGTTASATDGPSRATGMAPDYATWDASGSGADSSQYSSLDQINRSNVNQLQVAWTFETGPGQPPRFNPTLGGGRMYVITGANQIAALDPATGRQLWVTALEGRIGARGINYWQSADGSQQRLMVLNNGMLRAIDATNGQVISTFGTNGGVDLRDALPRDAVIPASPMMTDNPGRIYQNTIVMSLPAGAYDYASAPANIQAYDVITGQLKWTFNVVPREGEFGYDTWEAGPDHHRYGGVHNWSESTVDVENGIVFIPTGTPRYDFYGGNREGDNLFGNSLIALDANTGQRLWHYQIVHHDLWDFDLPVAPKLMTITKDGQRIPIVVQVTKHGFVFAFQRLTGEPVWPIEERPVPASDIPGEVASPTQPFPTWPQPFMRQTFTVDDINPYLPEADQAELRRNLTEVWRNEGIFTPPSLRGSVSMPGHNGGANWGEVAADPVRGRLYVVSRELPILLKLNTDNRPESLAAMPNHDDVDRVYRWPVNFLLQSNGMGAMKPPFSTITAYDMNTGEQLYQIPNGGMMQLMEQGINDTGAQTPRGGPVATAGGLLFVGTASDRMFRARDADTGRVLWEYQLDAATEGVPATYMVNGRQYVTIPVGGEGHFLGGLDMPDPGPGRYITFALPAPNPARGN